MTIDVVRWSALQNQIINTNNNNSHCNGNTSKNKYTGNKSCSSQHVAFEKQPLKHFTNNKAIKTLKESRTNANEQKQTLLENEYCYQKQNKKTNDKNNRLNYSKKLTQQQQFKNVKICDNKINVFKRNNVLLNNQIQQQQKKGEQNSQQTTHLYEKSHTEKLESIITANLLKKFIDLTQTNQTFIFSNFSLNLTRILLTFLKISVLVLLCNLNIGFANGASTFSDLPTQYDFKNEVSDPTKGHYTHTWAVHIPQGDEKLVNEVAKDHGFVNMGKIFDDFYHFSHHKVSKRSLTPAHEHQNRLDDDHRVYWAEQQKAKSRRKRDFIRMRPSRTSSRMTSLVDAVTLDDPKWSQMWYLNRGGGLDMNVIPAWKEGITGKGIVVTILDDGLESDHPDIEHNYDPKASYDVNSHDDDPMPHYDMTDSNRHGTRCAGEVAATANNSICAVGIAYGASVGGVRMLDGDVTDAVEARSLSLNPQHIDIYSASWGPDDDGKTVDGPGELASRAFIEGVTKGRNGKGSIFIWASGNGGRELDNCNCDGYTNSIWTLSISSATEEGHVPWYSEKCSSTLATTYSSGGQSEKQVVTTDLHHSCTISHTGTSASAPLAAGIAALVLESNQNLTWRDLQHIVVRTAKPANLKDPTWSKNGVGRRISHSFGYGLMDAAAMVKAAQKWKTVPEQQRCEINSPHIDKVIPPKSYITLQLAVQHCSGVNYLEHVQAKITLTSQRRGDIQLYLKSPAGTKVTLLTSRVHDVSRSGFNQWPFMSVHTWGESPHGNWQLEIHNEGRYMGHALLREWSLIFYGTTLPIGPNDPISVPRGNSAEITTPNSNSASTTTNLHQIYSPQYPRISQNNIAKTPLKISPNKSIYLPNIGTTNNPVFGNAGILVGNNKKQQQHQLKKQQQQQQTYQQISATYGIILGTQKKNNNNNNNNNSNNKNNKNKAKSNENSGFDIGIANNGNIGGSNKGGNKGNKNTGGNNNSAITYSGKSAANKKEQSTQSIAANSKNKFYRILQQKNSNINNKSNAKSQNNYQISRPKSATAANSASSLTISQEKLSKSSHEDKMNRKVIGDIIISPTSQNNIKQNNSNNKHSQQQQHIDGTGSFKTISTQVVNSNGKLPIKATKQIKESVLHKFERLVVSAAAADQRIPKLFERYEKIQAIFPEFQPYQEIKDNDTKSSVTSTDAATSDNLQKLMQSQQIASILSQNNNEAISSGSSNGSGNGNGNSNANGKGGDGVVVGGSGSKPSRENSKKSSQSFIPDQKILRKQQMLLKAVGFDDDMEKSINVDFTTTTNRKNTNAQITQWDLIFYGTEIPAQPDDPIQLNPGPFSPIGNDMEHNDIEFDPDRQWRNMQQIGESSLTSKDRTNTSCLQTTINQRCLACAPPTFLFNGSCFDECPAHTYAMTSEKMTTQATDITNKTYKSSRKNFKLNPKSIEIAKTNYEEEELQSTDRRRRHQLYLRSLNEFEDMLSSTKSLQYCELCDNTCYRCYGPLNSQCSSCFPGSQLHKEQLTNETFCYTFAERSSGFAPGDTTHKQLNDITIRNNIKLFLTIVVSSVVLIPLIIFLTIYWNDSNLTNSKCIWWRARKDIPQNTIANTAVSYAYDRVALLSDNDDDDDDDDDDDCNDDDNNDDNHNHKNLNAYNKSDGEIEDFAIQCEQRVTLKSKITTDMRTSDCEKQNEQKIVCVIDCDTANTSESEVELINVEHDG